MTTGYTAKELKRITTLLTKYNHKYIIVQDENKNFWGIRIEYIKDGRLEKPLNGITGNIAEALPDCIERCNSDSEFRHYKEIGYSWDEIVQKIIDDRNKAM